MAGAMNELFHFPISPERNVPVWRLDLMENWKPIESENIPNWILGSVSPWIRHPSSLLNPIGRLDLIRIKLMRPMGRL